MSKRIILFGLLITLLFPRFFEFANLQINEIMYDLKTGSDDGREWVEIYNDSDVPVDLSTIRLFEADTNHKIKLVQGNANVVARGYAVIASNPEKFKIDWPNFGGIVFDSTFSLNNSGEVLAIKDKNLNVIDQFAYSSGMGGAGDGKSLQKINGVWTAAIPTPAQENKIVYVSPPVQKSAPIVSKISEKSKTAIEQKKVVKIETPIQAENLSANVFPAHENQENNNFYFFVIILCIFLGLGGGAVYFIRKKRVISMAGDDFKILDK